LNTYPTTEAFYAESSARERSPEVDFGVMWHGDSPWPQYRVSWVEATGELYALCLARGAGDKVRVLGVVRGRETVDALLAGWAELADSNLDWITARLEERRTLPYPTVVGAVDVEEIKLEGEEDGWHLLVQDADGNDYDFRIQGVAYEFAGSRGLLGLLEWRAEGEAARLSRPPRDEPEETGYALDDPKHPTFHERMADLADARPVLGMCPHGVNLDTEFCPQGCRA
jgi:hypothetical protein